MNPVPWRLVGTVACHQVARLVYQPVQLLWVLLLPLVFAFGVAHLVAGSEDAPEVLVVDEDGSPAAAALVAGLEATPYRVQRVNREQASRQVATGRRELAVVIPAGFGRSVAAGRPVLEVLRGPQYDPGAVEARARAVAGALAAAGGDRGGTGGGPGGAGEGSGGPGTSRVTAGGGTGPLPVVVEAPRPGLDGESYVRLRAVWGVYVMFVLATLLQVAGVVHEERRLGTLQRQLALGVPYMALVAGHGLGLVGVGALQAAVFLAVSGVAGVPWLAAGPAALLGPVAGTLLAAAGLAMAVAGLARTAAQVRNAAVILAPSLGMLGGAFWPLEIVPAGLQQAARVSPVYWSMEALREGFVYGGPAAGQAVALAVLLALSALGAVIGVYGLRRLAA